MLFPSHCFFVAIVQGKASASREATFWDDLVDLVTAATIPSQSDQVGVESLQQGRSSLQDQFQKDCHLMSSLCRQGNLKSALSTNMTLFPPDLIRICEQRQATTASVSSSQHQKKVRSEFFGVTLTLVFSCRYLRYLLMLRQPLPLLSLMTKTPSD